MILADSVCKSRDGTPVLKDISLHVQSGERVVMVGQSGSGKSTLLRLALGLEPFEAGALRVANAELKSGNSPQNASALRELRTHTGAVFQGLHLFEHFTALQNVIEAPTRVRNIKQDVAIEEALVLLDKVGVAHRRDARPRQMSGGEQQRVAIARALAMRPKVLFMDEPTSALDPERSRELAELLITLSAEGLTLFIVTHDFAFARQVASRVLVLEQGSIVREGAPDGVL